MIVKLAETNIKTKFGEFKETLFYNGQKESHALVMGNVDGVEDVVGERFDVDSGGPGSLEKTMCVTKMLLKVEMSRL